MYTYLQILYTVLPQISINLDQNKPLSHAAHNIDRTMHLLNKQCIPIIGKRDVHDRNLLTTQVELLWSLHLIVLCRFAIVVYSPLVGCWSLVYIRRIIYKFLNVCPFDYTAFVVSGEGWVPVNRFNHTSWMTFVTPTDRPKSVRNR